MSTALLPWLMAALLALASATLQWTVLRARHRQALEAQRARLEAQQKVAVAKLDHAKRQIAQLQQDLAAARLELKQRRPRAVPPAPVVRSSPPALCPEESGHRAAVSGSRCPRERMPTDRG